MPQINTSILMSGADYFSVKELNPYEHDGDQPDVGRAISEHNSVKQALESAGVRVTQVPAPVGCQDGVYTANWALIRGKRAVLANLPNARKDEEPHARRALEALGFELIEAPYRFSGQGDALPCGNYLFCGSNYRTDPRMHEFLASELSLEVISLEAIPALDASGAPVINKVTGWPDSYFYDLDLAVSVLREDLIAYCPAALTKASQEKIAALPIDKIEVSLEEAKEHFACNLVSTGETVVMSATALALQAAIEAKGLKTITPEITELAKGGGYIRCTSLTLD